MEILKYEEIRQGGFAGVVERSMVMDRRAFGERKNPNSFDGIGNFIYLADGNIVANGETTMHPHHEIDVITVMVDGRVRHAGSLGDGEELTAGMAQVQRAGGEGFTHNEINPDDTQNRVIQMWVAPETPGEPAGYKTYTLDQGKRVHVYGGSKDQSECFDGKTQVDIVNASAGQRVRQDGPVIMYVSKGGGDANGRQLDARTLVQSDGIDFTAREDAQVILVYATDA